MHVVSALSDSEDIRIYIDHVLHLRIPRDKNTKVQSWIEGHSKTYVIEIWSAGHQDVLVYDNRKLWKDVLDLLDEHL